MFYAFKFYDYDNNDNIGPVDIVNLVRHLPLHNYDSQGEPTDEPSKIDKLLRKHAEEVAKREEEEKERLAELMGSQASECDSPDWRKIQPLHLGEPKDLRIDDDGESSEESGDESAKENGSDDER